MNKNITLDIIEKYSMFNWSLKHYCKNINLTFDELERIPLEQQDLSSICLNEFIIDKTKYKNNYNEFIET